jgi:hypothetical protein
MKKVIGSFEPVSFPDFGVIDVIAKIDTGALSGALHATNIKEHTLSTGERAITFHPYGRKVKQVTLTAFEEKEIRSSNGIIAKRYVISTTIVLRGVQYPIKISLSDRTTMMKGVLIGRRFLQSHGFIVDVTKGNKYRYDIKK